MSNDLGVECVKRKRGITNVCSSCGGWGVRWYGSTATWRGGIGGSAITSDICDHCWGSGDANRPWLNLRKFEENTEERIKSKAMTYLSDHLGIGMASFK